MVVSLHVASGAAAGAAMRSRTLAVLCGPVLHLAGDRVPHRDIPNRRFEVASGLLCVTLLAIRRGSLHPVTVGALFRGGHQTLSISFRSCGRAARNCFMAREAGTAPGDCQSRHSSCSPERLLARLPLPPARLHKQP